MTIQELHELADEYLAERATEHPESTVKTDRVKINQFLDWVTTRIASN